MPVICKICNQIFQKQITNKHLKFKHNLTTNEYKTLFGKSSLSSPEYRSEKSKANSGPNNNMFGKSHSESTKDTISSKNKGKIPHNKGTKLTDNVKLKTLKIAIKNREEKYKETGNHPSTGHKLSNESKLKISKSIKDYIDNHSEEILAKAQRILKTKATNGYFAKLRKRTISKHILDWTQFGYEMFPLNNDQIKITHTCGNSFIRNRHSAINPNTCDICFGSNSISNAEFQLREWIKSVIQHELIFQDRSILENGFEIDILIPALNIGIEYNGLYWHSEEVGKHKWYHATKYNKCKEKGIRLIQIFEDEWIYKESIVKSRLLHIFNQNISKISARKCKVEIVPPAIARTWHESHHIQGRGTGTMHFGLECNSELVAVMDFAKLSKIDAWELTRFSIKGHIPGAVSKLFSAFIKIVNPSTIISYSDCRWNTNNIYEKLGFVKDGTTQPNYWYVIGNKRFHRFKFRKEHLINEGFAPNKTEQEIMKERGYNRIWDCGYDKWVWLRK